jgi:hypothetical protein
LHLAAEGALDFIVGKFPSRKKGPENFLLSPDRKLNRENIFMVQTGCNHGDIIYLDCPYQALDELKEVLFNNVHIEHYAVDILGLRLAGKVEASEGSLLPTR